MGISVFGRESPMGMNDERILGFCVFRATNSFPSMLLTLN